MKVADLNLASAEGVAAFNQRAEFAARRFCTTERSLSSAANCRKGVRVELHEKLAAVRTAQAARANPSFAAR